MDEDLCIDSELLDHLDLAWGLIANVGTGGDGWSGQDPVWITAANVWRDQYHVLLEKYQKVLESRRG